MSEFRKKCLTFIVFLSLFTSLVLVSCNHAPKNPQLNESWTPLTKSQRQKIINKSTQIKHEYNGLKLIYRATVTFLTPEILEDNLNLKAQYKLWSPEEAENELSKQKIETADTAFFIVNIYTTNKKSNKLHLSSSGWSTALLFKNSSEIIKGDAKLLDPVTDHASVYYPYIETWDKTYLVKFKIGTESLHSKSQFQMQLSSPEGMTTFNF